MVKNYFIPSKAKGLDEFIISKLIEGVLLGVGLAVGTAIANIIEKRYFPDIARAAAPLSPEPLHYTRE